MIIQEKIIYLALLILKETEEVIGSVGSTYYEDVDKVGILLF